MRGATLKQNFWMNSKNFASAKYYPTLINMTRTSILIGVDLFQTFSNPFSKLSCHIKSLNLPRREKKTKK